MTHFVRDVAHLTSCCWGTGTVAGYVMVVFSAYTSLRFQNVTGLTR